MVIAYQRIAIIDVEKSDSMKNPWSFKKVANRDCVKRKGDKIGIEKCIPILLPRGSNTR